MDPDVPTEPVEACPSALDVVILTLLATAFSVGLGVLLFLWPFAGSFWEL